MSYTTSHQPIEKDRGIVDELGSANNIQNNMEIILEKLKNAQDDVEVCQCMEDLAKYITTQKVISAFFFKLNEIFFDGKNIFNQTNNHFTVGWRINSTVIPPQIYNENSL